MKFQIRHAYEGHSQTMQTQRSARGEAIMFSIEQTFKISFKDQMLITKSGHILDPNSPLERELGELDDRTITSSEFKNGGENNNQRLPCVYFFDLKELNKVGEKYEPKSKEYWGKKLQENMKGLKQIKTTISLYDNIEQCSSQQLKTYQKYVSRINSLKAAYQKLANEYSDLKESSYKVEEIIDRCSHQRKAGHSFLKNIKEQSQPLLDKIKYIGVLKQKLAARPIAQDRSLRENSGFFESQKNSCIYGSNYRNLKGRVQKLFKMIKVQLKQLVQKFKENEPNFKDFGSKAYSEKIDTLHQTNRKSYDQILTLFKQLVQKGGQSSTALEAKLAALEENAKNSLFKQLEDMMVEITNTYIGFCYYNEENKYKLRQIYSLYKNMIKDLKAYYGQAKLLQKEITLQLERQEKSMIEEPSEQLQFFSKKVSKEESQVERRLHFNKVINFIQSLSSKLCEEEELLRKKFISEAKGSEKLEYECLKNVRVPEVDIEDNSSSDKELWKLIKPSNEIVQIKLSLEQFVMYNYNLVLEKVKSANINETNTKIKNLQEILKRAVEILPKIYNNKIDEILKENQTKLQKIPQLQQNIKKYQAEIQQYKQQLLEYQRKLGQKQQLMIVRQRERCEEINKERSKYDKLYINYKQLQSSLSKQSQINEQLCNEIVRIDEEAKNTSQMNSQLKEMLALKELEIIAIEKRLQANGKEEKYVEEDLKSAVLNNFSKDIDKDVEKDHEIQRLNQQILILQRQNEELEEEYDQLNAEMRKIITKETDDIGTQTNTEQSNDKSSDNDIISINEEITVGQNALFMPFSSNIYVGVTHKDDDRTISNINRIQPNHFMLDISSFSIKIKELLTQCSFLVVLQVSSLSREGKNIMVKGKIKNLLGFEDDSLTVKNYAQMLTL